jgi:hypothetical protein
MNPEEDICNISGHADAYACCTPLVKYRFLWVHSLGHEEYTLIW